MKQADRDWIAAAGLGVVLESQTLKGSVEAMGKGDPVLVLTTKGLYLVATQARGGGSHFALNKREIKLEKKMIGDVFVWQKVRLSIPTGRSARVQLMLARFNLGTRSGTAAPAKTPNRYLGSISAVADSWLRATLAPNETLLVWLETGTKITLTSPILGKCQAPYFFFVTDHRLGLVALSETGDMRHKDSAALSLSCEATRPYARLLLGGKRFQSTLANAGLFRELSDMTLLGRPEVYRSLALLNQSHGGKSKRAAALSFLQQAARLGDPLAGFLAWSAEADAGDVTVRDHWLQLLAQQQPCGTALAADLARWSPDLEQQLTLLEHMLESPAVTAEWSLSFHRALHEQAVKATKEPFRLAALDLALAAHLKRADAADEAKTLLEARLAALPMNQAAEVSAFDGAPVGRSFHLRLYELLLSLETPQTEPWRHCLDQLVALDPLHEMYLAMKAADPATDHRFERLLKLLRCGNLHRDTAAAEAVVTFLPLTEPQCQQQLQHPLVRQGGVLAKVQQALAKAETPDRGALRNFCERLNQERFPELRQAVRDAALVLGMGGVEVYVSRGDKSIGARGFEGSPPFLLLGGDHLDRNGDYYLSPAELRFVIAAEMAHIRFRHGRFRPADVWAGAWDKGRGGLDILLSVVPLLKGVSLLSGFAKAVSGAQAGALGKVLDALGIAETAVSKWQDMSRREPSNLSGNLSMENETLVTTQRVLQLTADRVGLLLCDDPLAALRGVFLVHSNLRETFRRLEDDGLQGLQHLGEVESAAFADALQRVPALLSFYLSPEYAALRAEVTEREALEARVIEAGPIAVPRLTRG